MKGSLASAVALVALVAAPVTGSCNERIAHADDLPLRAASTAIGREPRRAPVVQDDSGPSANRASDARIAEYIEMHGRATDSSGRASLMPWSALKQIAN